MNKPEHEKLINMDFDQEVEIYNEWTQTTIAKFKKQTPERLGELLSFARFYESKMNNSRDGSIVNWALVNEQEPPTGQEVLVSDGNKICFDVWDETYTKEWNNSDFSFVCWAKKPKTPRV